MQATRSSIPLDTLTIGCHRCDGHASIRRGKVFLCPRCAAADTGTPSEAPLILCDLCDRESLVRVGERFLCARCALATLFVTANDVQPSAGWHERERCGSSTSRPPIIKLWPDR